MRGRCLPLLLLPLLALSGCVTAESTLHPDGSATIALTYQTPPDATEFLERQRFSSPHVHVESVKIHEDQRTELRATVDDVTALSTAEGFALVRVERARACDDEVLTIHLTNPRPGQVDAQTAPWIRIGITLPGPVRRANRDAQVAGTHVAWAVSRRDYSRSADTVLRVRYGVAAPA